MDTISEESILALVLVVDDVSALAEQYAYDLRRVGDYETCIAAGGKEALDVLEREAVDCIILDLEMPGIDGFEVLRTIRQRNLPIPVIVYTGAGNFDRCIRAIKLGAYSFIDKAEPMERVVREVENALVRTRLETEVAGLRRALGTDSPLLGESTAMCTLKEHIARLAPIPSGVLIVGESGTGKELVARELHRIGFGDGKPFVPINCAALPEHLVESELFGHERGAFTGAQRVHKGAFERAGGGTLFLDEIGDLPLSAQAKLLRVLEQREVSRVGGERVVSVNARVVAATHRDLEAATASGDFRRDLYFRLNVHILPVPPLRDRHSDIPDLASHFLAETCRRFGMRPKQLAPKALERLMDYDWKRNNIRELRNIVERMVIAAEGEVIGVAHVPAEVRGEGQRESVTGVKTFQTLKAEAERQILVAALNRNDWHITRTAAELGLSDHASLLKIMRRHHLKRH